MAPSAMEGVVTQSDLDRIEEENRSLQARWLNASSRCFGDKGDVEDITEGCLHRPIHNHAQLANIFILLADIISTVEFDHTGNYLATGDKGGRVVLFERNESVSMIKFSTAPLRMPILCRC